MSCRGAACGQFRFFLYAQGVDRVLPGQVPYTGAARQYHPQHLPKVRTGPTPFCTSDPHSCAQQTGNKISCPAGRQQRASVPVLAREAPACCHPYRDPASRVLDTLKLPGPSRSWCWSPPACATTTGTGALGAGPHRRPGSAGDHRPATADARLDLFTGRAVDARSLRSRLLDHVYPALSHRGDAQTITGLLGRGVMVGTLRRVRDPAPAQRWRGPPIEVDQMAQSPGLARP